MDRTLLSEDYYQVLAELKQIELDSVLRASKDMLKASGIMYAIVKDIEAYGFKVGKNEKYLQSIGRIFELETIISNFGLLNDRCYILRNLLKDSVIKRDLLITENDKLKGELQVIKAAYEAQ